MPVQMIHETTHFSMARAALVYNFFPTPEAARAFADGAQGNEDVVNIQAFSRYWDTMQIPLPGTKARIVAGGELKQNLDVKEHVL